MNRKQKVLTVIALIAFVVIGVCHYLAWPPIVFHVTQSVPYTEWKQLTYDEAKQQGGFIGFHPQNSLENEESMFFGYILEQGGYTTSSGSFHPVTNDQMQGRERVPLDAKVWFEVPSYALKTYWHPYFNDAFPPYAIIPDVRIPWFMLGVIYTGLFFLLADRKERR